LALLVGLVTAALALLASGRSAQEWAAFLMPVLNQSGLTFSQGLGLLLFAALAIAWTVVSWLFEPFFGLLYYGAIGLAASTLARSRGAAIVLMVAAHFCLGLGLYAPVSQISSLFMLPLLAAGTETGAVAFLILTLMLQVGLQTLLPWAVMVACGLFTLHRVEAISD